MSALGSVTSAGTAPEKPLRPPRRGASWGVLSRLLIVLVLGAYFLAPLAASFIFSVQDRIDGGLTGKFYTGILTDEGFLAAFGRSLLMAVLTIALSLGLMIPTILLVHLRLPRWRPAIEFLTLLPLVLPPIALVVGVRTVLGWAPEYFFGTPVAEVIFALQEPALPWILVLVYVILALPFVYRALDSGIRGVDLGTLVEAAQNLGASWPTVLVRVVVPNLLTGVLNASFLTLALVLGEFTIASILGFETFPTWIVLISGSQPQLSVSVSLLSLLITWGLLLIISAADRRRAQSRATR